MPSYVIVGASRGLGYEWLRTLSASPSNIVIGLARNPGPVESKLAAENITNVHVLAADMVDPKSLAAAAEKTTELTKGSVDYLIVNGAYQNHSAAGLSPVDYIGKEADLMDEFRKQVDVNVVGVIYSVNAFLPLVRKSQIKKITVVSSGLGDVEVTEVAELPSQVVYSAAKAALNMVVMKYAIALKGEGVVLLALSPGVINTRLTAPTEEEMGVAKVLFGKLQKVYPHWEGPATAAESVADQIKVIEGITIKDSGKFLSHKGNKEWL